MEKSSWDEIFFLTRKEAAWIKWSLEQAMEYMLVYGDGFEEEDYTAITDLQAIFKPYDFDEED